MLAVCQLDKVEQASMKFKWQYKHLVFKKIHQKTVVKFSSFLGKILLLFRHDQHLPNLSTENAFFDCYILINCWSGDRLNTMMHAILPISRSHYKNDMGWRPSYLCKGKLFTSKYSLYLKTWSWCQWPRLFNLYFHRISCICFRILDAQSFPSVFNKISIVLRSS